MSKLKAHDIRGKVLKWIEDRLEGRRQRVVLNGSASDWADVLSGVPQGSVLGPLLFVIYVNDIDQDLHSKLLKFADDTKLFGVGRSVEKVYKIWEAILQLCNWSSDCLMMFNVDECKVMHTGKHNSNACYITAVKYWRRLMKKWIWRLSRAHI